METFFITYSIGLLVLGIHIGSTIWKESEDESDENNN
jgi:hypothetical protein